MSQSRAIVDKLLTNVSNMYVPDGYVSEQVLPVVTSKQKTGLLGKYGTNHLRIEHSLVGGRAEYKRVDAITRSSTTFHIDSHGLAGLVSEDDYANVELPYKAEEDEVMGLTSLIWLNKEKALADTLTSTSIITQNTTLAGTAQFNDYANSDPLDKFKTARTTIRAACGLPPNVAVMDWKVANTLAYHPGILEALGFTQNRAGQLSDAELAKAMGVERLLIAKAVYESAKEGQSSSLAAVWGSDVFFAVCPTKAAPYQVSLGYTVQLEGRGSRRVTKSPVNNPPNSTEILVDDSYDFLISTVAAGYLIKSAIA